MGYALSSNNFKMFSSLVWREGESGVEGGGRMGYRVRARGSRVWRGEFLCVVSMIIASALGSCAGVYRCSVEIFNFVVGRETIWECHFHQCCTV